MNQRFGRSDVQNSSLVQDCHTVAQLERFVGAVRREQHRATKTPADLLTQEIAELPGRHRIEAPRRLVQQQNLRFWNERAADQKPLLHARREPPDHLDVAAIEANDAQHLVDARIDLRGSQAIERRVQPQVLACGQPPPQAAFVGDDGRQQTAHVRRPPPDVEPMDGRSALVRCDERRENLEQCRLAGAIRTEQSEELPRSYVERHVVKRLGPPDAKRVANRLEEFPPHDETLREALYRDRHRRLDRRGERLRFERRSCCTHLHQSSSFHRTAANAAGTLTSARDGLGVDRTRQNAARPVDDLRHDPALAVHQREAVIRSSQDSHVETIGAATAAQIRTENHVHVLDAVVPLRTQQQEANAPIDQRLQRRRNPRGDSRHAWRGRNPAGHLIPQHTDEPPIVGASRPGPSTSSTDRKSRGSNTGARRPGSSRSGSIRCCRRNPGD